MQLKTVLPLFFVLVCGTHSALFAADRFNPETAVRRAEEFLEKGDYVQAIEVSRQTIMDFPASAWDAKASQVLGLAHFARGEKAEAIEAWKRTVEIEKNSPLAFRAKLNIALTLTQMDRAEEAYETIFDVSPQEVRRQGEEEQKRYFLLSGMVVATMGRHDLAAEIYAVNMDRFDDGATRAQFLDNLEEAVSKLKSRDEVDVLLAKDLPPEARRRIRDAADKVPKLQKIGSIGAAERGSWNDLKGLHPLGIGFSLAYFLYVDGDTSSSAKSSTISVTSSWDLGDNFSIHGSGRAFAFSLAGTADQPPRLLNFDLLGGKTWRLGQTNAVQVQLGAHYTSYSANMGVPVYLSSRFGPKTSLNYRHWLGTEDYFSLSMDIALYGSDSAVISPGFFQWTLVAALFRQYTVGIRRMGVGLEVGELRADHAGSQVRGQLLNGFMSLHF